MTDEATAPAPARPAGDYAIVEQVGHSTFVGRVVEVERFGSKMLQIEPVYRDELLEPLLIGGSTIYRFTPCTAAVAFARQAKSEWDLPSPVRAVLPAALLPAPDEDEGEAHEPEFAPSFLTRDHDDEPF